MKFRLTLPDVDLVLERVVFGYQIGDLGVHCLGLFEKRGEMDSKSVSKVYHRQTMVGNYVLTPSIDLLSAVTSTAARILRLPSSQ